MNDLPRRYELIEHTADIGITAFGRSLEELFINAAWGMFNLLADLDSVKISRRQKINLTAANIEELFLAWLSELLYHYSTRQVIFREFAVEELSQNSISAEAGGEVVDLKRHHLKSEIKAVTYHQLRVQKVADVWQGQVIFDV